MVVQWWMNGELVLWWPNELGTTISLLSAFYFKPPFICFQPPTDLSWTPLIALGLVWRVDLFVRCIRLCSYEIILTSVYFSSLLGSGKKCRATGEVRESSKGKKESVCSFSYWEKVRERQAESTPAGSQAEVVQASRPRCGGTTIEEGLNGRLTSSAWVKTKTKTKKNTCPHV